MPTLSRADFDVLLRRAGLILPPAEADDVYTGWLLVEPMLGRLRTPGRGREAEPAHVFRPDTFGTEDA